MKKIFLLISATVLASFCFSQPFPTAGLIARWEFTGNLQDGQGSNHGTWMGSGSPNYVPDRCGNANSAISFNGTTDFIRMTTSGISGSGARSISFWMQTTNCAASTTSATAFVKTMFNDGQFSASSGGTRWEVNHNYFCQGIGVDVSAQFITRPNTCHCNGTWHHVVVTQAANSALNTVSIYFDGNLITGNCNTSTSSNLTNNTVAGVITIGAVYQLVASSPDRFFSGALDDFFYYNTVLTQGQVMQLFNQQCNFNATCATQTLSTGCCIGNPCVGPLNPLLNSWQVPLTGKNYIFSEPTGGPGRVGIGSMVTPCSPGNLLEVRKGSTSSISGLRLTDLAGAIPGLSTGNVLSVNGSGDVILVPDKFGTGGTCAKNGLNCTFSAPDIELGGTLYHTTNIDQAGFPLTLSNGIVNHHYFDANGATYHKATGPRSSGTPETAFYDDVVAWNTTSNNFGRQLFVVPAGPNISPGSSFLVGTYTKVDPTTPMHAVTGKVIGEWSFVDNKYGTGSNIGGNFASVGSTALQENYGIKSAVTDGKKCYGVYSEITNNAFNAVEDIGIFSRVNGAPTTGINKAGDFFAANGQNVHGLNVVALAGTNSNYGIQVSSQAASGASQNRAGEFIAVSGQNVYGGYFKATNGTASNYGIYSFAFPGGNSYAGYFDGDIKVTGTAYGTNMNWTISDQRYKKDIKKLEGISEKLQKISGYNYYLKTDEYKEMNFDSREQMGFLAQELKEVFPQLVKEDNSGNFMVNYQGMIPVLVEAIKEQQKQIDEKTGVPSDVQKQLEEQKKINESLMNQNTALSSRLDKLEQMINSCCSADQGSKAGKGQAVNLTDKNVIVLNQNVPNPFAESTVITYTIPTDFARAQLIFSTSDGKIIKTVDITTKGDGYLSVFANDLSNGLYSYSLVVDGKVIATKKMVKQN
jgi:hypothetical protein